jgi:hypothetical protein
LPLGVYMKFLFLIAALLLTASVHADTIVCNGLYKELGIKEVIKDETYPLTVTQNEGGVFQAQTKVHDRVFSISGNINAGSFMLFQTWGNDLTEGTSMTGSFNADGHLQISTLADIPRGTDGKFAGSILYKLVCQKSK